MSAPAERMYAVPPPPPELPDDGPRPSAVEVPPLARPPASLTAIRPRRAHHFSIWAWATFCALFLAGVLVTVLVAR